MKRNYRLIEHVTISTLITLICLSTLLLSTFSDKKSTSAIASYYNFIVPKVRLTNQYNRKYSYRFHLNPRDYVIKESVNDRHHVTYRAKADGLKASLTNTKNDLDRLQAKRRSLDQDKLKSDHFDSSRVENALVNNIRLKRHKIHSLRAKLSQTNVMAQRTVLKARIS